MKDASKTVLRITGLDKAYGAIQAVRQASLVMHAGEVVAICGRSGSGKSTLLRCVNFLETPDAGTIEVDGAQVSAGLMTRERQANVGRVRMKTGMVFQAFHLFPHMTALQNVIEGLITVKRLGRAEAIRKGEALLERVGLADKRDVYPVRLSGGQAQRVAIARALAMEPALLLFDEPTSALDPELIGEVLEVIRDLAKDGRTMLIVTHEVSFARDVADRVVFMDQGSIIIDDAPDVVFRSDDPLLKRFFASVRSSASPVV